MHHHLRQSAAGLLQILLGGLGYGTLEILWRGYTHVSMILLGGVCFFILIRLSRREGNLWLLCAAGGGCITFLEFGTGCVVNLWLHLDVWDYSQEPLQLLGQVCLRFTLLWCVLCAVVIAVCRRVRKLFTESDFPQRYKLLAGKGK